MKKDGIIHWLIMFILMYLVFSLKFVGLSIYGYWMHRIWYWFDDAFYETFKVTIIAFVAVFLRAKIFTWIELNKNNRNK